jgi:hypothetical protein
MSQRPTKTFSHVIKAKLLQTLNNFLREKCI